MAINLDKNKKALISAWEDVVNEKTNTDWALYGYEGQTFDLKVVSKGDGGLEELTEDLSSGKIMYAFCRVLDPNTSLPKFVLINWQGEAAPTDKKGKCANHIRDVAKFFKGAHVTINARTDDDMDAKLIVDKVSKSTASSFNFKVRSKPEVDARKPVGSVYKRIIPTAEINAVERDRFWEKEEAEEKKRLEEEHKKADDTRKKLDDERRNRELEEAKMRDEMVKQRMRSISEIRNAEKPTNVPVQRTDPERTKWEKQLRDDEQEDVERRHRSESLRNERKQEAQALIAQRSINARAVFEQNSAAGQMNFPRKSSLAEAGNHVEASNTAMPNSNAVNSVQLEKPLPRPDVIPSTPPDTSPPSPEKLEPAFNSSDTNTIKRSPRNLNHSLLKEGLPRRTNDSDNEQEDQDWEDDGATNTTIQQPPAMAEVQQTTDYMQEQSEVLQCHNNDQNESRDQGLCARALYDYQAADDTEISFDPDDIISHIDQIDEGWWQGMARDGTYGLFPANYVELID